MGIKVGIAANPTPPLPLALAQATAAEEGGFDSIWYPDHMMGWFARSVWTPENSSIVGVLPSPHLYLDPTIVIALAGQATDRIMIGTGVTEPIRRHPAEIARTFLTLSHATEGRGVLGIGAGERENTEPYGLSFARPVSRLEESLTIIRALWESKDYVDFEGRFFKLRRAVLDLEPYGDRFPPIWIGAHGPRMLDLTGRFADGWYPSYPMTPGDYAGRLAAIRKAAGEAGRDPSSIVAGYQLYTAAAEDHDAAHELMQRPLVRAMALVGSSAMWELAGRKHPLGEKFEGLKDFVPEWHSREELERAMDQFDLDVIHDLVPHGSVDDVVSALEPYVDAGLQHAVLANTAPLGGLEYLEFSQQAMREIAGRLR